MKKCLLSIDWDYFIHTQNEILGSYIENTNNAIHLWYKRYIQEKARGKDIRKWFQISPELDEFWQKIREHFIFAKGTKSYVSDSHALSYKIAKEHGCKGVYLFDAHADLGYGGMISLDFPVHCANWLGKLLKDRLLEVANILYSPYTLEKEEDFKPICNAFNIRFTKFSELDSGIEVSAVHICRSGAWTPPWLDGNFYRFVENSGLDYELKDCPVRKWDTKNINYSDQVRYLMA